MQLGPLKLESDSEFMVRREHPLIWKNSSPNNSLTKNDATLTCRNSVQGRFLLVDDRGFVCPRWAVSNRKNKRDDKWRHFLIIPFRFDVLPSGCCNLENTSETKYLACDTCNEEHCCAIYEYCVSCCLHPEKVRIKNKLPPLSKERVIIPSFFCFFRRRKDYSSNWWRRRPAARWPSLQLCAIILNFAWPSAAQTRIRWSTRTSTETQRPNTATGRRIHTSRRKRTVIIRCYKCWWCIVSAVVYLIGSRN